MYTIKSDKQCVKNHILWFEGSLLNDPIITVSLENPDKFSQEATIEKTINTEDFRVWAQQSETFNWCMDYHDPSSPDGHGQVTGQMTWEEYCTLPPAEICRDMEKYLLHVGMAEM